MAGVLAGRLRRFFLPEGGAVRPAPYAVVTAVGLALATALALTGPLQRLEWDTYDALLRRATQIPEPSPQVVVVAIDEMSFAELGLPWPWPRAVHAQLIESIASQRPASIALDIVFEGPGASPEGDVSLATAIRSAGNVVLAADVVAIDDRNYSVLQPSDPLPLLASAAAAVGLVAVPRDPDGTLRRIAFDVDGRPTLAAAALRLSGASLPADPAVPRLMRFNGPPRIGIETVSYYQALEAARLLPRGFFTGKHVFVGRSLHVPASDEADHLQTPMSPQTPGVELHATAADAVLRGRFVTDPFAGRGVLLGALLALGCLVAAAVYLAAPGAAAVATTAAAAALVAAAAAALASSNVRLPVVAPILAMVGAHAAGAAYRFALVNRERRLIKRAFKNFVAPAIVDQMLADPSRLKLGGDEYDMTVLFSDLEGFTQVAERLTPPQLTSQLTDYFRTMIDRLLAEQATLDKLIGDAIMVFFGCPVPDPDHPLRACRAALAMQRAMADVNREWVARGLPRLRTRIGINSGRAVAGNMGTDRIFNYTVLGDTVNLASRLEGVNREYGTLIIIGEATCRRVASQFEVRELDWIRVKGRQEPVAIYELLSETGRLDPGQLQVRARYAAGLEAYRASEWSAAAGHFAAALEVDETDGPSRTLLGRCGAFIASPPASWDGVHVMPPHSGPWE